MKTRWDKLTMSLRRPWVLLGSGCLGWEVTGCPHLPLIPAPCRTTGIYWLAIPFSPAAVNTSSPCRC